MTNERMTVEQYAPYVREFQPDDYDPRRWARLAKQAGMSYVVLTAKHHDGFCLFDSALTDYNAKVTCGRDLVGEFVEAVRAEGLRVGLYYSLLDWHHPDYPKYADMHHPMRGNPAFREERVDFDRYLRYMHGQVEELVTHYGRIDLMWFDFSYGPMKGETWKAAELVDMVRRHQPDILIDNRLETSGEGFGSILEAEPQVYSGDFASPEQLIPPEGIRNVLGQPVPWELCCTMNNNWGYCAADNLYKPASLLIRKLVECVSKGGNMILNAGPDAHGRIDHRSQAILEEMGIWMAKNGSSIRGCTLADLPKPEWGRYTRNGSRLYAHVFEAPIGPLALTGLNKQDILRIRRLADGAEVRLSDNWVTTAYGDLPFVSFGEVGSYTYPLPDPIDTVLEITLR